MVHESGNPDEKRPGIPRRQLGIEFQKNLEESIEMVKMIKKLAKIRIICARHKALINEILKVLDE